MTSILIKSYLGVYSIKHVRSMILDTQDDDFKQFTSMVSCTSNRENNSG